MEHPPFASAWSQGVRKAADTKLEQLIVRRKEIQTRRELEKNAEKYVEEDMKKNPEKYGVRNVKDSRSCFIFPSPDVDDCAGESLWAKEAAKAARDRLSRVEVVKRMQEGKVEKGKGYTETADAEVKRRVVGKFKTQNERPKGVVDGDWELLEAGEGECEWDDLGDVIPTDVKTGHAMS